MEQQAPILLEENLTGLPFFRNLILGLYAEWAADNEQAVVHFILCISELFKEPLVNFDKAYKLFCEECGNKETSNQTGDLWRVFLATVYSELSDERLKIVKDFNEMVTLVMKVAPGGADLVLKGFGATQLGLVDNPTSAPFDYTVLLALRIYLRSVRDNSPPQTQK